MVTTLGIHIFVPETKEKNSSTNTSIIEYLRHLWSITTYRRTHKKSKPSPKLVITRNKEPSLSTEVILITKNVNILMPFGELHCFLLPWKCSPNFLPKQTKNKGQVMPLLKKKNVLKQEKLEEQLHKYLELNLFCAVRSTRISRNTRSNNRDGFFGGTPFGDP